MKTPVWLIRLIVYWLLLFIAAVLVALLTPTTDAISMLIFWLPTSAVFCGIFEFGWFIYRRRH